jgi:hypothetical protein
MSKRRLHKAVSAMIYVQEIGFGLPIAERSYAVNLRTKGSNVTLLSYSVSVVCNGKPIKPDGAAARSAAQSACKYFVDQITDHIGSGSK